jgi:large subunit ribosomal protein L35
MAKMKTNSSAKKRFRKLGDGKSIKRARAFRRHLFTSKTAKRKRNLRKGGYFHEADLKRIQILLPN